MSTVAKIPCTCGAERRGLTVCTCKRAAVPADAGNMKRDDKAAAKKPPLALIPQGALVGESRAFQYGVKKYKAGNFLCAVLPEAATDYMGAIYRHAKAMQLPDGTWSRESLATVDPESGVPHLDHLSASVRMLRAILIKEGVLPEDPGVPRDPPPTADAARPVSVWVSVGVPRVVEDMKREHVARVGGWCACSWCRDTRATARVVTPVCACHLCRPRLVDMNLAAPLTWTNERRTAWLEAWAFVALQSGCYCKSCMRAWTG